MQTESVVERLEASAVSDKGHLNHFLLPFVQNWKSEIKASCCCLEDLIAIIE